MPVLRWTIGLKVVASLWGLPVSHGSNSRLRRAQAIDSHPHRWSTKKQQLFLPTSRRHCYSELMLTTQPQLKPQQHRILWWAYLEQPSSVGDACGSAGLPPKKRKRGVRREIRYHPPSLCTYFDLEGGRGRQNGGEECAMKRLVSPRIFFIFSTTNRPRVVLQVRLCAYVHMCVASTEPRDHWR